MNRSATSFVNAMMAAMVVAAALMVPAVFAKDDAAEDAPPAHHHHHHAPPAVTRMAAEYLIPQVTLVRDDGKAVSLPEELNDGRPVVLAFMYTSCTEICPVTSHTFSQLQDKLGADRDRVHMVSITIDPEEDTPERLAAYAQKFGAGPEWRHYSGTLAASITAQRAFDAYRGEKMNHTPVTFLRGATGNTWIRIDGFATADQLLAEVSKLLAAK